MWDRACRFDPKNWLHKSCAGHLHSVGNGFDRQYLEGLRAGMLNASKILGYGGASSTYRILEMLRTRYRARRQNTAQLFWGWDHENLTSLHVS